MKKIVAALVSCGMLGTTPAMAEEFISGVYAASTELCEKAKATPDGLQTLFEEGNTVLTHRGIEGIEYHCDFLQVLKGVRTPGFLVSALCEEPGYAFPDTIAIVPRGEGELELTASSDFERDEGEPSANSGLYYLCDGVALP